MRTAAAIALVAALALFPAGADARRHRAKPTCTPHGSKTIDAGPLVRVFSLRARGSDAVDLYACRYKTRRRFLMGSAEDLGGSGDAIGLVRIAGLFVAWDSQPFDDTQRYNPSFTGFPSTVIALNTKSGAKRSAPAASGNPTSSGVSALVLQPTGSFAWIGSGGPAGAEVHRYDAAGDTVLASGADIDPTALAASSATLFWLKGGAAAFAPFS